ncbi:MAG: putative rane protein, partial [Actinobacteria bacterium]|nr:putative rane protein [Actinomycetota bacterium]
MRPGLVRRTARAALVRVDYAFSRKGPAFKQLAVSWSANVAGDTLVAVALAGTLFFDVPSAEARDKVALYLLITLAPFAIVAPVLATVFKRFPGAYRTVLNAGAALRAVLAVIMAFGLGTLWLFPLAFGMLVLSRLTGISKSSLLPVALPEPVALVAANAQLARFGIYAGGLAGAIGAGLAQVHSALVLALAAVCFTFAAFVGLGLPNPRAEAEGTPAETRPAPSREAFAQQQRSLRLSRLATAVVRLLNGFLVALLAFEFKEGGSALDFGTLIGAAGIGFGL